MVRSPTVAATPTCDEPLPHAVNISATDARPTMERIFTFLTS